MIRAAVAGAWLNSEAAVSLSAAEGWNGSCSRLGGSGGSSFHYLEFSLFCREGGGRGLQAGVADYPAAGFPPPHRISLRLAARLLCNPYMVYTINRKHG